MEDKKELAVREDVRFILTLGKDVERWFERMGNDLLAGQSIHL
ncbi:hypothetical protein [Methanogenium marinum]|nr:hypothetical protein [Methanogenium marinum]